MLFIYISLITLLVEKIIWLFPLKTIYIHVDIVIKHLLKLILKLYLRAGIYNLLQTSKFTYKKLLYISQLLSTLFSTLVLTY